MLLRKLSRQIAERILHHKGRRFSAPSAVWRSKGMSYSYVRLPAQLFCYAHVSLERQRSVCDHAELLRLAQLDLDVNKIGDAAASVVARALAVNHTMTTVCCAACYGNVCLPWSSPPLFFHLAQLNLQSNKLGDTGAAELVKALAINCTMKKAAVCFLQL